ncbi:hypothetical protein BAUCODRAFT_21121 [Baudoinia panamericana UAMH 10762]|uniref:Zn(2)-C6 fungal-type domain-containing protein n=1 Tax=Baudoinia panamericana (strain UAMH 10762) TaxID=717646 RepID=M2M267_BAUPA|nr:uncharacterized protein BAUCODRAFT_21121 [Baudoinia panamericana UAMH 10762]EMD01188.1 hypothetical protein BAUCODRAFT_21121 [Baudoinia panamericana UAMH 10762]
MEEPHTHGDQPNAQDLPSAQLDEREKRKRQPRNTACQACAAVKMKCLPGPVPGRCERCHRTRKECHPAVPKPRKRRMTSSKPWIANHSPAGVPNGYASPYSDDENQASEARRNSLLRNADLYQASSKSLLTLLAHGLAIGSSEEHALNGVDHSYIHAALTVFRSLASNFPFATVHSAATAIEMVINRPLTTIAICTVSSLAKPDLQGRLAQAFRLSLSAKVIVQGDRSLDAFAGLLIFLTWHHNYMAKPQIYQLMCLLAGMAADLGLHRQPSKVEAATMANKLERDRAFLGCYYLCCGLSLLGFNKPNPLRWTDNLRRLAEAVASRGSQPTDRDVVGLIELMRAINDIQDSLPGESDVKERTRMPYTDMHIKATSHRFKALKREYPSLGNTLVFGAATIHFHYQLLQGCKMSNKPTLIQCACAIKEYFDDILARPPSALHQVTILDWANLLEVLVLMARIWRSLPNTMGWEAGALSSMLQPDAVLDAVCAHMSAAPTNDALAPRHEGQLRWFRGVCASIKERILHEQASSDSTLRNEESQYDTVHSLGQTERRAEEEEARFRPADSLPISNEALPPIMQAVFDADHLDPLVSFENGVLDEEFWANLMAE